MECSETNFSLLFFVIKNKLFIQKMDKIQYLFKIDFILSNFGTIEFCLFFTLKTENIKNFSLSYQIKI